MEVWIYWLIIAISLIIFEALTANIVCIWFIISSLIALIISLFIESLLFQIAVFVFVGILLLIFTKPIIKKYLKIDGVKTNLDRVVGMTGFVTDNINKDKVGEVKVDGKKWSAISNEKIKILFTPTPRACVSQF